MLGNPLKSVKPTNQLSHTHPLTGGSGLFYTLAIGCRVLTNKHAHSSDTMPPGLGNTSSSPSSSSFSPFSQRRYSLQQQATFLSRSLTRCEREISDTDQHFRKSVCLSQMQAGSWCLFNASLNREVKWPRLYEAARLPRDKSPFHFLLLDRVRWLFKAASNTWMDIKLSLLSHRDKQRDTVLN